MKHKVRVGSVTIISSTIPREQMIAQASHRHEQLKDTYKPRQDNPVYIGEYEDGKWYMNGEEVYGRFQP